MIVEVDGQSVEITNWGEFEKKLLDAVGFQLEAEIVGEVDRMRLTGIGELRGSYFHEVKGNELVLSSSAPHAVFVEFGTFSYFDKFGVGRFPIAGYPVIPKKKELSKEEREKLPKGMQPFAPIRRVLFNDQKMKDVIEKGIRNAV
jgi:hypothetical protein